MKGKFLFNVFCLSSCFLSAMMPGLFDLYGQSGGLFESGKEHLDYTFPAVYFCLGSYFYFSAYLLFWNALPDKFFFIFNYLSTSFSGLITSWYSAILISWRFHAHKILSLEDFSSAIGGSFLISFLVGFLFLCFWTIAFLIHFISSKISKSRKLP